eukprot:3322483-Rhodomonas_salina.2
MSLRVCDAMSSTDVGPVLNVGYGAMRCLVMMWAMLLRVCYALCGTDLGCAGNSTRRRRKRGG